MQSSKIKNLVIVLLLACIAILATCEFSSQTPVESSSMQDTIFLTQWRREKRERLKVIASYESRINRLQTEKDSLQTLAGNGKKSIAAYRFKAKLYEGRLKDAISSVSQKDSCKADTIAPILDSLIIARDLGDAACDTVIHRLELMVMKGDSSIRYHENVESGLWDVFRGEQTVSQHLREELDSSLKRERKKERQNKVLRGTILVLTGVTSAILITQTGK